MDFNNVAPAIVLCVYCIVEIAKATVIKTDKQKNLLPVLCIILGSAIALALYVYYPQGIQCTNAVDAVATGGVSGIAATGCNQLYKQFIKFKSND